MNILLNVSSFTNLLWDWSLIKVFHIDSSKFQSFKSYLLDILTKGSTNTSFLFISPPPQKKLIMHLLLHLFDDTFHHFFSLFFLFCAYSLKFNSSYLLIVFIHGLYQFSELNFLFSAFDLFSNPLILGTLISMSMP